MPTFILEDGLSLSSDALIAGVDEVGRGPLAGPVVASAVIINRSLCSESILCTIDDSKRLSPKNRNMALTMIRKIAITGTGFADRSEIDELNIFWASMLAMERAIEEVETKLDRPLDAVLVDGNRLPNLKCPGYAIVKGDTKSISIAAASIVAKTTRDDFMLRMASIHPEYGWEKNMGYGTQQHLDALKKFGPTKQHRRSFRPVLEALKTSYRPLMLSGTICSINSSNSLTLNNFFSNPIDLNKLLSDYDLLIQTIGFIECWTLRTWERERSSLAIVLAR